MNSQVRKTYAPPENYSSLLTIGLVLAGLMIAALSYYWLSDSYRMAQAATSLQQARLAHGQELYTAQCAGCHGPQGEGGIGLALNNPQVLKNTPDAVFFSLIRTGVPQTQMPAWSVDFGGPLTDEDIHSLVTLIRSWEKN